MNRFLYCCLLVCFLQKANSQKLYQLSGNISENDYLPKTIILKVKPAFSNICEEYDIKHSLFSSLLTIIEATNLRKKFPFDKSPIKERNELGQKYADLSLVYELNYLSNMPIEKAISKLLSSGILVYAEPHFIPKLSYTPTDPLANATDQYHLQTMSVFNAWDFSKGDSSIVIGITDTGTDYTHNDLFNNIKRNYADVIDGIDNDNDGYIDNYMGWDVAMNDNDATWQSSPHGVHVSGISSASTDNTLGIAGIGFNCKFLPVKIGDAGGLLIAAYEGIKYAADHGCDIINCSWGGAPANQYGQDIIDYATINKNCLVVAAAGNNGAEQDYFPGAYNYVLAVANTTNNDTKYLGSNYGYFVDVCAPGYAIKSTWTTNSYIALTGTSMSSPMVAGAAGIVKKIFPSYTGLQIAERLKVTSDNIYPLNPSLTDKLGSGRINLFRAITDAPTSSVVFMDKVITDHNDEIYVTGDTLFITGKFINYLAPTGVLNVTVTPLSAYASSIDSTTSLGVINTLASVTNTIDPFQFKLMGSIPLNQTINFEVVMSDGVYQAKQFFSVLINTDYINITVNDIYTTATSKGRIGYNSDNQQQGLGFKYKGIDLLSDGGLMIGCDSTKVSDCVRGTNGNVADADFGVINRIVHQIPSVTSDFDTKAKMDDHLSPSNFNVSVDQNTFAWSSNPNKQFVILEYTIKNTHVTDTIKNMFVGIFADWDIDWNTATKNRSAYDAVTKMGYCYSTVSVGKYAGIKLLTNNAPPNFYAIDQVFGGNGGIDITNGFDTKEKYKSLSTQRLAAGVSGTGSDNLNVMSTGPIQLLPNQSTTIAFAMLAADSLSALINVANQSQIKYGGLVTSAYQNNLRNQQVIVYPNPTKYDIIIFQKNPLYNLAELYTLSGSVLFKHQLLTNHERLDLQNLSQGMYILKLTNTLTSEILYKKVSISY